MTDEEIRKKPLGLYLVFWKDGGSSLAAIGQTYDGSRWLAPVNWTHSDNKNFHAPTDYWHNVKKVELITT